MTTYQTQLPAFLLDSAWIDSWKTHSGEREPRTARRRGACFYEEVHIIFPASPACNRPSHRYFFSSAEIASSVVRLSLRCPLDLILIILREITIHGGDRIPLVTICEIFIARGQISSPIPQSTYPKKRSFYHHPHRLRLHRACAVATPLRMHPRPRPRTGRGTACAGGAASSAEDT